MWGPEGKKKCISNNNFWVNQLQSLDWKANLLQWPERLLRSHPEMTWPCTYSWLTPVCWSLLARFGPLAFLHPWSAPRSPSSTWHMALVSPPLRRWGWRSRLASPPDWWAESRIAAGLSALWGPWREGAKRSQQIEVKIMILLICFTEDNSGIFTEKTADRFCPSMQANTMGIIGLSQNGSGNSQENLEGGVLSSRLQKRI